MRRRPTIPFFQWRIAVHLEQTKQIQNQPGMPAYQCQCELCSSWKHLHSKIFPPQTIKELQRLGVQLDAPNELYGDQPGKEKRDVRVVYHIVGKILSGPENTIFHNLLGDQIQNYVTIRNEPWLSVRVLNANEAFVPYPAIDNAKDGDVIALDFRFQM
jgi:hypothetical protein